MNFPLIDALRAFCAISVVVYHVIEHFKWTGFPASGPLSWFRFGWLGVDVFFVISGFVISLSAFNRIDKEGVGSFRRSFMTHRVVRIVPLHYLTCILFVIFIQPFMLFSPAGWTQSFTHAFFVHNLLPMHQGGINGVNWSLGDEMQFYVLILMFAPVLLRLPWPILFLGSFAVAWAWRFMSFNVTGLSGSFGAFFRFWLSTQLPGMLDEFGIGILLARLVRTPAGDWLVRQTVHRFWALPLVSGALLWAMVRILWTYGSYWDLAAMVVMFRSLIAVTCASVLLTVCALGTSRILRLTAPLRYLGTVSYGIYLWHLLVILSLRKLDWLNGPRALPVVLAVTIGLASLSWHFFERPFLDRLRRRTPVARAA